MPSPSICSFFCIFLHVSWLLHFPPNMTLWLYLYLTLGELGLQSSVLFWWLFLNLYTGGCGGQMFSMSSHRQRLFLGIILTGLPHVYPHFINNKPESSWVTPERLCKVNLGIHSTTSLPLELSGACVRLKVRTERVWGLVVRYDGSKWIISS